MDAALLAAPVTAPGYLIEIGFDPIRRYSTRGLQAYAGQTWIGGAGWTYEGNALRVPGGDPVLTRLILSQGVVGRTARVWMFYGDTAHDGTTQLVVDGFCDGAPALTDSIVLPIFEDAAGMMYAPRKRLRPETGFNVLPQPGLKLYWNGATIVLNDK